MTLRVRGCKPGFCGGYIQLIFIFSQSLLRIAVQMGVFAYLPLIITNILECQL